MTPNHERGGFASSLLVTILLSVALIAALAFGIWAFIEMGDYKNNSDEKSAQAVAVAEENQKKQLEAEFSEREKQPNEVFTGPSELGSVTVTYPRTWELYVDAKTNTATPLDGYAHPGYVPGVVSDTAFALRFQVVEREYSSELKTYDNAVKTGKVKISPYRAPNASSILGSRVDGEIVTKRTGNMVLLPLRDKTLKIWTESPTYTEDFNTIVAALTFVP